MHLDLRFPDASGLRIMLCTALAGLTSRQYVFFELREFNASSDVTPTGRLPPIWVDGPREPFWGATHDPRRRGLGAVQGLAMGFCRRSSRRLWLLAKNRRRKWRRKAGPRTKLALPSLQGRLQEEVASKWLEKLVYK